MIIVLLREDTDRKRNHTETQLRRLFAETEIGIMPPQTWSYQKPEETRKDSLEASEEVQPCPTWILNLWSTEVWQLISIVLSHLVCGSLL